MEVKEKEGKNDEAETEGDIKLTGSEQRSAVSLNDLIPKTSLTPLKHFKKSREATSVCTVSGGRLQIVQVI